jgi:hypothetical protein
MHLDSNPLSFINFELFCMLYKEIYRYKMTI